jgi:hypothetical protein
VLKTGSYLKFSNLEEAPKDNLKDVTLAIELFGGTLVQPCVREAVTNDAA